MLRVTARWLVILAASGCNWVFDIDRTRPLDAAIPIDAQYFDAPPDAPPACPGPGSAPMFQAGYFQLPVPDCTSYVPAPDWGSAVAYCYNAGGTSQGTIDTSLAPSVLTPLAPNDSTYIVPRVSADGQVLFAENTTNSKINIFHRSPDDSWALTSYTLDDASYRFISNATRGPVRHAIQSDFNGSAYSFIEYVEQPSGEWTIASQHGVDEIGMGYIESVALSPDGLHMTLVGIPMGGTKMGVFWTRRADLASNFGMVANISTVPQYGITTPYITEDCSRIYFSALQTVFYQKLQ